MKRKAVILAMAAVLAVTSLTGCTSVKGNETAITVGEDKVTAGVANFYARYTQAQYETYYAAYLGENMWSTEASEGKTYEESVKADVQDELEKVMLMKQHMDEYNVEITDAEKNMISKSAAKFNKDNELENKNKVSGDKETVKEVLTLMTVKYKMSNAIGEKADQEVTDEEAAQKKMDYVYFAYTGSDENGNAVPYTKEQKADLKKDAEAMAEAVKAGGDLAALAEEKTLKVQTVTFDKESTTPETDFVKEAYKLHTGDVQMIETKTGCYVVKITSDLDADATAQKKAEIINERKADLVAKTCDGWKKDTKIKVNKNVWKKMDFNKLRVKMKLIEEQPYTDAPKTDDQAE